MINIYRVLSKIHANNKIPSGLKPAAGRNMIKPVTCEIKDSIIRLNAMIGNNFNGSVSYHQPGYQTAKKEVLNMMALVLSLCPLDGTDGQPGTRTYYAHPMDFGTSNAYLLRSVGKYLCPDNYSPNELKSIIGKRSELYKFEIRLPSDLIGFSLDASFWYHNNQRDTQPSSLVFEYYDGGAAFGKERSFSVFGPGPFNDRIVQLARVGFELMPDPIFDIDLSPGLAHAHNIDEYGK